MTNKYPDYVYTEVRKFYKENFDKHLSDEEIDKMSKFDVLDAYLLWEGIYGYTHLILDITEA